MSHVAGQTAFIFETPAASHAPALTFTHAAPAANFPDLGQYDRFVVAFSGGKDSLALVLALLRAGVPRDKIELHHHERLDAPGGRLRGSGWPLLIWLATPRRIVRIIHTGRERRAPAEIERNTPMLKIERLPTERGPVLCSVVAGVSVIIARFGSEDAAAVYESELARLMRGAGDEAVERAMAGMQRSADEAYERALAAFQRAADEAITPPEAEAA